MVVHVLESVLSEEMLPEARTSGLVFGFSSGLYI